MNLNKEISSALYQKALERKILGDVGHYHGFMKASQAFLNMEELTLDKVLKGDYQAKYVGASIKKHVIDLLSSSESLEQVGYNVSNPHKHYTKRSSVLELISPLQKYLESNSINYQIAGSYRRQKEYVGDLDILVTGKMLNESDLKRICTLTAYGSKKAKLVFNELEVDIRAVEEKHLPCTLQYFTGSRDHNLIIRGIYKNKGFKLNEYCITDRKSKDIIYPKDEKEIYSFIGQTYVEPMDR
jgi:DNA polymerase/3'-5' exonuclease PolX